jgi:hypothetical protein
MHSSLTEMLASAHRDELRRQASQHRVARQGHQSRRQTAGTSRAGLLSFRLPEGRSQVRPAVAA